MSVQLLSVLGWPQPVLVDAGTPAQIMKAAASAAECFDSGCSTHIRVRSILEYTLGQRFVEN